MKKLYSLIALCIFTCCLCTYVLPCIASNEITPASWIYVDGLGRSDVSYEAVPSRTDHPRYVGIFYHTWHTEFSKTRVPVNLTEVIKEFPDAAKNVKTNNAFWYEHFESKFDPGYFWNEPIFGYYTTEDEFVLRKHAELLADAGVDFIYIDGTNGTFLWEEGVNAMLKVWHEAKEDGVKVPQIVFWLNLAGSVNSRINQLQKIYLYWYSQEEYSDLWFQWEEKPLVLCFTDVLEAEYDYKEEIESMFTFRQVQPSYFYEGGFLSDYWGWLSVYPQCEYGKDSESERPEQMAVGVAQNADSDFYLLTYMAAGDHVMGRSYAADDYSYSFSYAGKTYVADKRDNFALLAGRNFQQQWDYAIECDPDIIMVTAWNEWTAYRSSGFCDAFTDEYSRDIEPSKGELKDHYYYQLVANVRRYKGHHEEDSGIGEKATIDIHSQDLSQWDSIKSYNHYTGSTRNRDTMGYLTCEFKNFTMRNDIVKTKVAYDDKFLYFYVSTVDKLTKETDKGWMRLFLDTDYTGNSSNWEGFEYVINRINPSDGKCILEKSCGIDDSGQWQWEEVASDSGEKVEYSVSDNVLQLKVPQNMIDQQKEVIDFGFKWSDNMNQDGDVMDFYSYGDVAPGGRFCFHFHTKEIRNTARIYIILIASVIGAGVVAAMLLIKRKKMK